MNCQATLKKKFIHSTQYLLKSPYAYVCTAGSGVISFHTLFEYLQTPESDLQTKVKCVVKH